MKKEYCFLILASILVIGCATISTFENSAGYIIKTKDLGHSKGIVDDSTPWGIARMLGGGLPQNNWPAHSVECNKQTAYAIHYVNDVVYLCRVEYDGNKFFVIINRRIYNITIDQIMPDFVAYKEMSRILSDKGFNSSADYYAYLDEQKELAERQKILERLQRERERAIEEKRLSEEIDKRYGVVSVVGIEAARSNNLVIGNVYRLNTLFFANNRYRGNGDTLYFGEFDEYEILGLRAMLNANAKEVIRRTNHSFYYTQSYDGRKGYIVKYLGPKEVITVAGLVKIVWAFEYIGVNRYAE